MGRDPRLTPARPDLASAALRGQVEAPRFVEGEARVVVVPLADVRRHPRPDAPLDTQALRGERVTLFDENEGWGWVQLAADGYVGYVAAAALGRPGAAATHRVATNRTFVYPAADMKRAVLEALPLGAQVTVAQVAVAEVAGGDDAFSRLAGGGFVFAPHLVPVAEAAADFVATAERLLHVPYLWGGRSPLGIDCSGLVQLSLACAGVSAPRDADLQEQAVGRRVVVADDMAGLRRGDLVFWRGHVGIMQDGVTLLHANAQAMRVASEPLRQAVDRIRQTSQSSMSSVRRLSIE